MPSHQQRREPLPADYQFPSPEPFVSFDDASTYVQVTAGSAHCPVCHAPSQRGDICFTCSAGDTDGQYGHGV